MVSSTTIVAEQVDMLPQASVAVQVRVVVDVFPHPGTITSAKVTTGAESQSSVTVGATKTGTPGHSTGVV